jgi:hypothetical protein
MDYTTLPLSGQLAAGGYLVAASSTVSVDPAAMVVTFANAENNVQNGITAPPGAPDGIALLDKATGTLLDAVSYEGAITAAVIGGKTYNLVSGAALTVTDDAPPAVPSTPLRAIIRSPNGQDSGDDSVDWKATTVLTPGAANQVAAEMCTDGKVDEDVDGAVDCMDTDCAAEPACAPKELCSNGVDDDTDTFTDCADMDCDGKACDALGKVCVSMVCTCPGSTMETSCGDMIDDDCDGMVDCADSDCAMNILCLQQKVTSVDYPVIGGTLVITGSGFTGATDVTIGGVSQAFTVDSDTKVTLKLGDTAPVGLQDLVVTTPLGATAPFQVTVIRLQVNELDSNQSSTDMKEFIEISTGGVPGVSLAGYSIVFWNGSVNTSYYAADLNATTDANGLLVVGNAGVTMPAPPVTFANDLLQNGQDAVALYQTTKSTFPANTALTVGLNRLIDALVYDTADADDPELLDNLLGPAPYAGRVQVDEGGNGAGGPSETVSIQRCGDGRRNGSKFTVGTPTPGAANNVTACP